MNNQERGPYLKGEDRKQQFMKIIEEGRIMFAEDPSMSMNKLAKKIGYSGVTSLYRFIQNKRELWFAIIINDFCDFSDNMELIVNNPENVKYKETFLKLCEYFLSFSRDNFSKFKIMFLMEPPAPIPKWNPNLGIDERGYFEKQHEPRAFEIILIALIKAIKSGEITTSENPFILTGIIWSMLLGASTAVSPFYDYLGPSFFTDNLPPDFDGDVREDLHKIVLSKIEMVISS